MIIVGLGLYVSSIHFHWGYWIIGLLDVSFFTPKYFPVLFTSFSCVMSVFFYLSLLLCLFPKSMMMRFLERHPSPGRIPTLFWSFWFELNSGSPKSDVLGCILIQRQERDHWPSLNEFCFPGYGGWGSCWQEIRQFWRKTFSVLYILQSPKSSMNCFIISVKCQFIELPEALQQITALTVLKTGMVM